ncbi:MAG: AmmeMemoRadiSam system protein A [Nitrospirota bacterium]
MSLFPITHHPSPITSHPAHPLVKLAAEAIAAYLWRGQVIEPAAALFSDLPDALMPAGCFVCLKRQGRLRGCIGTTEPLYETLAGEVIRNAIGAATRDPRFAPVERFELDELSITVDVLGPAEPVPDQTALDHRRYGIVLRSGERRSVLLPDIEGIGSVAEQVAAARDKAGLAPHDPIELLRFEVTRYR